MKITSSDIRKMLDRINRELACQNKSGKLAVDYIMDKPRVELLVDGLSETYLNNRMSRKKCYIWLATFFDGLTFVQNWNLDDIVNC